MLSIDRRPSKNDWLMSMAWLCSTRATCYRGRAGCVITNSYGIIISTGYNGPSSHGGPHCIDIHCQSGCSAVHAEKNAILHMSQENRMMARCAYVTCSPCEDCANAFVTMLPELSRVYYAHVHHRQEKAQKGLSILDNAGIDSVLLPMEDPFGEHPLPAT